MLSVHAYRSLRGAAATWKSFDASARLVEPRPLVERHSSCKKMDAILSAIWYPVHALFFTPANDDDDAGVDPIYPLTVFFALGIWFVFKRYQYIRYRAVPFSIPVPEVSFAS